MKIDFTKKLLAWNLDQNNRSMPWKGETDPYRIWLSEIILQQTRVEQGTAYYERFILRFPTIADLASASEKEVFKYWEGLGYYSRCRNLIATAKKVITHHQGRFPATYAEILELPGIGPYTAAAISSFAFGLPYAVVDGNVERVLSRFFGISAPVGSAAGKKLYTSLAGDLLDKKSPGIYNQAIMDFGATICKPQNPLCHICIQSDTCEAFNQGWVSQLPVKVIAPVKKKRWFYYFIIHAGKNKIWIRKRTGNDIWQNLYEFVLWESGKIIPQDKIHQTSFFKKQFGKPREKIKEISPVFSQTLTHQIITTCFVHLDKPCSSLPGYESVEIKSLTEYPFPKIIADYVRNLVAD